MDREDATSSAFWARKLTLVFFTMAALVDYVQDFFGGSEQSNRAIKTLGTASVRSVCILPWKSAMRSGADTLVRKSNGRKVHLTVI